MSTPNNGWEAVHTVNEFWDRPRRGFADYLGRAHAYICEWDEQADDWGMTFLLSPVSDEQLAWATEDWAIFERWLAAYHAQSLMPEDSHPALADERPRHEDLKPLVDQAFQFDKSRALRAVAEFRGAIHPLEMEVRWGPA